MWSMILLMSCLPAGHFMSAGRRPAATKSQVCGIVQYVVVKLSNVIVVLKRQMFCCPQFTSNTVVLTLKYDKQPDVQLRCNMKLWYVIITSL